MRIEKWFVVFFTVTAFIGVRAANQSHGLAALVSYLVAVISCLMVWASHRLDCDWDWLEDVKRKSRY